MYLKRIELAGFKSFAERTIIEFDQGLTAVVGPNGSGKSNITDGIRWVLGEQSAKNLRGGKMPDVIFSGTAKRKPLNIAEVTLVLNNESHYLPLDFSEVSVTRRLNRNGESDYYINKQSCRLKDIVDLFTDSGLGKESFSIISQGKVEAIFNSKPEERRGIFEEAAGVLKYKQRKQQAENKLFETEDNLNRVQDIIYELEAQLEPLKEQSETAEEYTELKKSLTTVDIGATVREIEEFKSVWELQTENLQSVERELTELESQKNCFDETLEQLRKERTELLQQLDEEQQHLLTITEQYEKTEGQKNVFIERSKNAEKITQDYQDKLAQLEMKEEHILGEQEKLTHTLSETKEKREVLAETFAHTKALVQHYSKSTKEQLEELRSEYVEIMQKQANVTNDLKHLEKQYQLESSRNAQMMTKREEINTKIKTLEEKHQEAVSDNEEHEAVLQTLLKDYEEVQIRHRQTKQQLTEQEKSMYGAMGILQQAKARQKSLQELQENYTGFYQGVRAVLKNKEAISGIVGAVAELLTVPADLVVAIDTVLGAGAQNIVVKDEASGRAGIQFLKEKKLGRATFLPLTTIKPRRINAQQLEKLTQETGFLGIASELVACDSEVRPVIENMLGMTVVAKNLPSANRLAKLTGYHFRVVSLEGDVMNPGGSMTGGATKGGKKGNLLSMSGELEELTKQIDQMTRTLTEREQQVQRLKGQETELIQTLEKKREKGEQARLKEQTLKGHLAQVEQELKQTAREKTAFQYETKDLADFLNHYETDKEKLMMEAEKYKVQLAELDEAMGKTNSEAENLEVKREESHEKLREEQGQLAALDENIRHLEQQLLQKQQQLTEIISERDQLHDQLHLLTDDNSSREISQESLIKLMGDLQQKKTVTQSLLEKLKNQREEVQQKISRLDEQLADANKNQQSLLQKKTQFEVKLSRAENGMDSGLHHLQEEYSITFEGAKKNYPFDGDLGEARKETKKIKRRIEALGPVNLSAIEQYESVSERYEFLITQRDDLLAAKESLFQTMDEMDQTVKARFNEVFVAIREKFQETFPQMFGGGHADLVLTNPDDLLTTGIEIVAQPPGKRLQSLSLLSGGERALTAIALLFSIIQVRPVPFCVLDEVEAALDEANVARFGKYLSRFEKATQFIVITHRKGTMEAADVLYGVTMQESGISKIVSVRLEEASELKALEA
ncbi:chromosome segregation protein SMC [Vagococcus elongatus]|uniref:Chromosome partition protein Smc n=1 Tax=Vagococcus elongatus TaxID=180344 RepID=A0A430AYJ3_9ENTE|nr:chromosome segregation protein SMC [Vagococcus elongatus]RSU13118.1 chromosome segregation protein SMC [Vagococcus elongatus]